MAGSRDIENRGTARDPLVRPAEEPTSWLSHAYTAFLCATMVLFSVGLINFNKWLMNSARFPYAMHLVLIHQVFCTLAALVLLMVKPSMFPAFTDPDQKVDIGFRLFFTGFLPIAAVFAVSLTLSNMAYMHLGLAFIQMIKETNIIWVYVFSVIAMLEKFTMNAACIIVLALVGMTLTVKGETRFEMIGMVIQLAAVLCESIRITLQGVLLSGKKLDPFSYILTTSPPCGCFILGAIFVVQSISSGAGDLASPTWGIVLHWAPWLLFGCCIAFCLNISIAIVIKRTSPTSYVMCQLIKDVLAVVVSVTVLSETVSVLQGVGFVIQLSCVTLWATLKSNPKKFENNHLISGMWAVCCGLEPQAAKDHIVDKKV